MWLDYLFSLITLYLVVAALAIVHVLLYKRNSRAAFGWLGLILVYAATGVPFSVFILTSYFRQLPVDLTEAAKMDGAGEFTIFGRVMLPLVRPALATVAVFQFVPLWNDFFFPLVLLRSSEKWTLPVGMTRFFGEFQTDWSTLFAGIVITTLPLIVVFPGTSTQNQPLRSPSAKSTARSSG